MKRPYKFASESDTTALQLEFHFGDQQSSLQMSLLQIVLLAVFMTEATSFLGCGMAVGFGCGFGGMYGGYGGFGFPGYMGYGGYGMGMPMMGMGYGAYGMGYGYGYGYGGYGFGGCCGKK